MKKGVAAFFAVQLCIVVIWVMVTHPGLDGTNHSELHETANRQQAGVVVKQGTTSSDVEALGTKKNAKAAAAAEKGGVKDHYEKETILIALASYGDRECAPTIARAYQRAVFPDRVFFGVYQQHNCTGMDHDNSHCKDCTANLHKELNCPGHPLCTRLWQVRTSRLPMKDTRGVTFGRYMAEKHYNGETYVMNIDSHSHFSRGWDSEVIDMHKRIGDPYAIITTYPSHYGERHMGHSKDDNFEVDRGSRDMCICVTNRVKIVSTFNFKHTAGHMNRPKKPVRTAFLAAGFNFARGERVAQVPYDPYTPFLFDGEEMSFAVRAWTFGYDFYHPDKSVIAHLYIVSQSKLRPVFWTENWGERYKIQFKSALRVNYIIGLHDHFDKKVPLSSIDLTDAEKYGLGKARTPDQFWQWAGIDLNTTGPEKSKNLCPIYESGGMPPVHRKGIDPE